MACHIDPRPEFSYINYIEWAKKIQENFAARRGKHTARRMESGLDLATLKSFTCINLYVIILLQCIALLCMKKGYDGFREIDHIYF